MTIGYLCLFGAVLLSGAWFILIHAATSGSNPVLVQALNVGGTLLGLTFLALPLALAMKSQGVALSLGSKWYLGLAAGFLICGANILMCQAYAAKLPVGIIPVMLNLACVVPLLYGGVVLRQRLPAVQVVGIVLAVIAAILISAPDLWRQPTPAPVAANEPGPSERN